MRCSGTEDPAPAGTGCAALCIIDQNPLPRRNARQPGQCQPCCEGSSGEQRVRHPGHQRLKYRAGRSVVASLARFAVLRLDVQCPLRLFLAARLPACLPAYLPSLDRCCCVCILHAGNAAGLECVSLPACLLTIQLDTVLVVRSVRGVCLSCWCPEVNMVLGPGYGHICIILCRFHHSVLFNFHAESHLQSV